MYILGFEYMKFSEFKLNEKLLKSVEEIGFVEPTAIQAKCIPLLLEGKDIVGQSLTGSGKTAAFGLPIMQKIVPGAGVQALILTPTRELCSQVTESLLKMSRHCPINIAGVFGGVGFYQQIEDIKNAEIIVATPGRLIDHLGRRNVSLHNVKFMVLDEADRMLDMGFEDDVEKIFAQISKTRQTALFSATMPASAKRLINKYLTNPVMIKEQLHVDKGLLKQVFYSINSEYKFSLLVHLIKTQNTYSAIVFCATKRMVDKISKNMRTHGIKAMPIHGDLTQSKRTHAVDSLKKGKIDILVATDVAARGLDINNITHIYNYDVPRTSEEYIHRIGRTARAGKKGEAITLVSEKDRKQFSDVLRDKNLDIVQEPVPEYEKIVFKKYMEQRDEHRSSSSFHSRRSFGHSDGSARGRRRGLGDHRPRSFSKGDDFKAKNNYRDGSHAPKTFSTPKTFSSRESFHGEKSFGGGYGEHAKSNYGASKPRGPGNYPHKSPSQHSRGSYSQKSSFGEDNKSDFNKSSFSHSKKFSPHKRFANKRGPARPHTNKRGSFKPKSSGRSKTSW